MSLTFEKAFRDPHRRWTSLRELVRAWDHDALCRYRRVRVPITDAVQPGTGSNGGEHMQLKLSAADWMRSCGLADVVMERGYPGGIADVLSPGRRLAIECGWSDPKKLIRAAEHGFACVWLPYRTSPSWRIGDEVDALLIMIPHARRGEECRRIARAFNYGPESSARFLGV